MKKIPFYGTAKCIFLIILTTLLGASLVEASEEYGIVADWGGFGFGDGQFNNPNGIAVDREGNVYVCDESCRIQKFTSDGEFITKWGHCGIGVEDFFKPIDLAIDNDGNVYVLNFFQLTINDIVVQRFCNIQKFTSEGEFITKWGSSGTEDGQIFLPAGFAVDSEGNVFVADLYLDVLTYLTTYYMECRIQKFTSEGDFIEKWKTSGNIMDFELDFFLTPFGGTLAVDNEDSLCFLNMLPPLAQKILTNGEFTTGWEYMNFEEDLMPLTIGIAIDGEDAVYVAFAFPGYIKKFTSGGEFITKWDLSLSTPIGQFSLNPMGWRIAANSAGEIYHIDALNNRVQKYATNGQNGQICFIEKLYGEHSEPTELLRHFRDNVLNKTPEGQGVIRLYYEWSSSIVEAMKEDEKFKEQVKELIDGVIPMIREEIE